MPAVDPHLARIELQKALCQRFGSPFLPAPPDQVLGMSLDVGEGRLPVNGMRYAPEGHTTGWFVFAGAEPSEDPDYYKAFHVHHLQHIRPELIRYLGLAAGWRFQWAPGHEDVWFDPKLR